MALDFDGVRRPGDPDPERNRELIAQRTGWPPGALDAVRAIEHACPGWSAAWFDDWTVPGFERAAGFYAWTTGEPAGHMTYGADGPRWIHRDEVYGVTPDQLAAALGGKLP